MRIEPAGENTLIVYLGEGQSPEVCQRVQQTAIALREVMGECLIDLVPSYASLLVVFNPAHTNHLSVAQWLLDTVARLSDTADSASTAKTGDKLVTLPVFYSPQSGPDLENLADRAGLSIEQVIDIHRQQEYRVYAIGFAPGFAYLGEVDPRIAAPRLATPRQKVPRGAVAIADAQTAVYPAQSPGGWNLIGLCPQRMFNPGANPTMPVAVGDRVRFEAIDRSQFLQLGGTLA